MVMVMLLRMVLYSPILAIGGIVMVSQTNVSIDVYKRQTASMPMLQGMTFLNRLDSCSPVVTAAIAKD